MTEKKQGRSKKTEQTNQVKFSFGEEGVGNAIGYNEVVETIAKSVNPKKFNSELNEKVEPSKVVFASKQNTTYGAGNVELKGVKRLDDDELRNLTIIDPYVGAIISTRVAQSVPFGRVSESKFDRGLHVKELDPIDEDFFQDRKELENARKIREMQMAAIQSWVLNCGTSRSDVIEEVFKDSDPTFKYQKFHDFISCQTRNLLTFGRCATQIIRNEDGEPILFRAIPVETIYRIIKGEVVHISQTEDTHPDSIKESIEYAALPRRERPLAYVQRVDSQDVGFFTEDELHIWHYQEQALFNLNGYPLAPLEQALYMVFIHQQTLGYLRNQFVKGMASKGMLVLESTNAATNISEADLENFRQEFHNFVTRNDNSSTIPVISGQIKANFVPLNANPEDMQFLQVEEHVIRALCSAFQISPQEMGYGHLSLNGQGGISDGGKEMEIVRSEERGLRIILDTVFDGINEILYENFPDARNLYEVSYIGLGTDTREAVVQRSLQELQTTATMKSLWADNERSDTFPFGGDAPLAPQFNQFVVPKMFYGEYREFFLGDKGAGKKPEYKFIIDPTLNQAYMQNIITPLEEQREVSHAQNQFQIEQIEMNENQMKTQEQMMVQQPQEGQPQSDQQQGQDEPGQPQEPLEQSEDIKKPLRQLYLERKKSENMEKSFKSYLEDWLKLHE